MFLDTQNKKHKFHSYQFPFLPNAMIREDIGSKLYYPALFGDVFLQRTYLELLQVAQSPCCPQQLCCQGRFCLLNVTELIRTDECFELCKHYAVEVDAFFHDLTLLDARRYKHGHRDRF